MFNHFFVFIMFSQEAQDWLNAPDMVSENTEQKISALKSMSFDENGDGEVMKLDERDVILRLLDDLSGFGQDSWDRTRDILEKVSGFFNPDQPILACACCGEVHAVGREQMSGEDPVAGHLIALSKLSVLQLNPSDVQEYCGQDPVYRRIRSIYPVLDVVQSNSVLYYLHPEFVTSDDGLNETGSVANHTASLCSRCWTSIKVTKKAPNYSIAAKCDYGDIRRLPNHSVDFPSLTIAEHMAISMSRPYCIIVKMSTSLSAESHKYVTWCIHAVYTFLLSFVDASLKVVCSFLFNSFFLRMKLKSHMITMPFGGANELAKIISCDLSLPRAPMVVAESLKVTYVGASKFNKIRSGMLYGLTHAMVSTEKLRKRLLLYKAMNPQYERVVVNPSHLAADYSILHQIPRELQDEASYLQSFGTKEVLQEDADVLLDHPVAVLVHKPILVCLEGLVSDTTICKDIAHIRDEDVNENDVLTESFHPSACDEGSSSGLGNEQTSVDESAIVSSGAEFSSASLLITADGGLSGSLPLGVIQSRIFSCVEKVILPASDAENAPMSARTITDLPIPVRRGDQDPLNEYVENKSIYFHSYPELFLLGQGCIKNGCLDVAYVRHLNIQFTTKFATNKEFQFLVFNQSQRSACARAVSRKVKNHPKAMKRAAELFNSDEWKEKLRRAVSNPLTEEAIEVSKDVDDIMYGVASSVPHSTAERKNVVNMMYAMMQRYGNVSNFITFAPDDTNDIIMLRMCYATVSNTMFPAVSTVNYQTGSSSFKDLLDSCDGVDQSAVFNMQIPFKQYEKLNMAARNPVSTALHYQFMNDLVFTHLLGMTMTPGGEGPLKTRPRFDKSIATQSNQFFKLRYETFLGKGKSLVDPPLGRGLAGMAVTEEQKKLTLHTHAAVMTTLKPAVLQSLAGHAFLEKLILHIISGIYKTELPAVVHFKSMALHEAKQLPKRRFSRDVFRISSSDDESTQKRKFCEFVSEMASTTNKHHHIHPGACTPKPSKFRNEADKLQCRFALKAPECPASHVVEITESHGEDGRTSIKVEKVISKIDPLCLRKNRPVGKDRGLLPRDARALVYETSRKKILSYFGIDEVCYSPYIPFYQFDYDCVSFLLFVAYI